MKNRVWQVLALAAVVSMLVATIGVQPISAKEPDGGQPTFTLVEPVTVLGRSTARSGEAAIYIVLLEGDSLARHHAGLREQGATPAQAGGGNKLDAQSPASVAYLDALADQHARFTATLEQALGRSIQVLHRYDAVLNGLAVRLTPQEAAEVANLPGVRLVQREVMRQLDTDAGPAWIGAEGIWDGSASGAPSQGEGIVIGVIDTGINGDHPSFADPGPSDGYDHVNPKGAFFGDCAGSSPTYTCNDKLIGVYDFTSVGDPEDFDGHGSHTASTAAGNVLEDIDIDFPTITISRTISGVAPHANIIAYRACVPSGCPDSATNAAINQAVLDEVDVINYSIGGGERDPWGDSNALAYLDARAAGVFVATSAGNDGPGAGTIGSPANAPWLLSVGNATHNRTFTNTISFSGGPGALGPFTGTGVTSGYGPAAIVHAADSGDALCTSAFPANTWTAGEIVVCDRGGNALVDKVANAESGGAAAVVIANAESNGLQTYAIPYELPGTHLNYADAEALRTWLASGSGHQATISDAVAVVDNGYGDRMAVSSSRGPNDPVPSVIKPDVIAPGSDILAAYKTPEEYNMISGTSMSSPHAAGAAALLLSVHPGWTPAEVQAALVSTAESAGVVSHDWITPAGAFDRGGGRVSVSQAAQAGFVLDETPANFANADPTLDGDPSALNLASLGNAQCVGSCSWTRVLSSTWDSAVQWDVSHAADTGVELTIEPLSFELAPGATQLLTITAGVSGATADQWHFGEVVLTPSTSVRNGMPTVARLPLAIKPSAGSLPNRIEIHTRRNAGSQLEEGLESMAITDLTIDAYGLVRGTLDQFLVQEIANPSGAEFPNVFFAGRGHFTEITVPGGSPRLVVEVVDTMSPDLDLLVFYDANDNGQPELADLDGTECQSADAGSWERCDVASPAGGRWFAATINFDASTPGGTDAATLSYAAVDGDAGNLAAEGPSQVDAGTPYDLRVYWDVPTMVAGDRWYGVVELGSAPGSPGDIGRIPVDVIRHADDVTKSVSPRSISPDGTYTLAYTITVQANVAPEELVYSITDTIPSGMTYVPGSAMASSGTVDVTDNQLIWSGTPVAGYTYEVDTSWSNPACQAPGANSGAYLDLVSLQSNLVPNPTIDGDTLVFSVDFAEGAHNLFGKYYGEILNATATGFMYLEPATEGDEPWINDPIPTASDPNNLMAVYWRDLQIVYDGPANKGVTLVNATDSSGDPFAVIEYDDIEPYPAGSTSDHFDFELIAYYDPDPNRYEYIFAYDNLVGDVTTGTIGLEDLAGTFGVQYAYNDVTISDGLAVCFDLTQTREQPATITYQVTVTDAGWPRTFTNEVDHQTDNPGSQVATTSVEVTTTRYKRYLPLILVNQ